MSSGPRNRPDDDVLTGAWSVEAIRAAEHEAMAHVPPGALMRRAAAGLARRCVEVLDRVYGAPVVLLVGKGDNGGDALFAGAALARRGAVVRAVAGVQDERVHRAGLTALRAAGGRLVELEDVRERPAVVVDGLLGIGGRGGLRPDAARLALAAEQWRAHGSVVVAVDLPSGVDADTGEVAGAAVTADVTVAFGSLKAGLLVGEGAVRAGLVEIVDIGLSFPAEPLARLVTADAVARWWPRPGPSDDKYTRGVVGVAAGSEQYPGAAILCTGGALSGPSGYVRYAGAARDAVRTAHPEVVSAPSVADAGRVQAWVVGSGLGTDDDAVDAVRQVLATDLPVLLDADGLTIVAREPALVRDREAPTLLTPHDREYARLAGDVGPDRIDTARRAARELGVTVLLKGYRTVIASPDDAPVYVVKAGVPELATAGTGDVLSGVIGSLLAGGVPPAEAAAAGAFVHGTAGRLAAEAGPVVASRVLDHLPAAVQRTVR
ncbi:NAD(P)H-hydrate dehydratase [Cryptosporangium arvum]|uniref:NAD(P)H-hydrate dehydratase n=1 Tax=Cryptosporangium arvum TaxID=80871 RepID=UPI0004BB1069|nr:NAD(P)H-hydrate dehydratase [Cryptosporangium arvum]